MKNFSCFFIQVLLFAGLLAFATEASIDSELRQNINKVTDLSKIKVVGFKWQQKAKTTLGIFEYIEVFNNSSLDYRNIKLEVFIYNKNKRLYKFIVPMSGELEANAKKKFRIVTLPILPFDPDETIVNILSAELLYVDDDIKILAENAIKIISFDHVVENVTSKVVIVNSLKFKNESENFFKNIVFSINFLDQKGNSIKSVPFKVRGVIGPKETRNVENFQVPGIGIDYFSNVQLSVFKGELINYREYLEKGGKSKFVKLSDFQDVADTPLPRKDLKINKFTIVNKSRSTIGLMTIDLSNKSRYEYENLVLEMRFINSGGNTISSKKIKIKEKIKPFSERIFSEVNFGIVDNDFSKINLTILSASMIGSSPELKKVETKDSVGRLENKNYDNDKASQLIKFDSNEEILVLDANIGRLASLKILNLSNHRIFNPTFKLILLDDKSKVLKTLRFKLSGFIEPKSERTYRSIEIDNLASFKYESFRLEFLSGEKLK